MSKLEPFLFFRAEGFYVVEIPPSQLLENVRLNPGTLRVEDVEGDVVWEAPEADEVDYA